MVGQIWPAKCPISARGGNEVPPKLVTSPTQEITMSYSYREVTLNWLALGLLLAAWNASDDAAGPGLRAANGSPDAPRRPAALRGYAQVSVRAAARSSVISRGLTQGDQS